MLYMCFTKWAQLGDSLYSLVKKRETRMGELVNIYTQMPATRRDTCHAGTLKFKQNGCSSTPGCDHSYSSIKVLFSG